MDEQKLRDLLEAAGREYNQGKYQEAIAHWQQVLALDATNQKAREGIRMAQLLVVNWESSEPEGGDAATVLVTESADGETQEKIQVGISRVRELLSSGRTQEALEGCQLLAEIAPGMDSVKRLLEEVTQIHEAQPFIRERIERARKYLAQGRTKEAAEEARNVLTVDRGNRDAQSIFAQATGAAAAAEARPRTPSAFQVEKAGKAPPPSPFAGRSAVRETDALLAQFEFEEGAAPAAGGAPRAGVAAPGAEEPISLEMDADAGAAGAKRPEAGPAVQARVRALIEEGEKNFAQKQYQRAIDAWSRIFALDETNSEAGVLIDRAKGEMEDLARQADEAYYRGVDLFEQGNYSEARHAFEDVLALQRDHADARNYLEQIAQKTGGARPAPAPPPEAAPAPPKPAAGKAAPQEEAIDSSSVPLAASSSSARPAGRVPAPMMAGVLKRKPIERVPPSGRGKTLLVAGAAVVIVLGAGGWYLFMMGGSEATPPPETAPLTTEPAAPEPATEEPPSGPAAPPGNASAGPEPAETPPLQVLPGKAAGRTGAPAAPDPAALRRKADEVMKEGRALYAQEKYADAVSRFEQVVSLDPTNFDAEDWRSKAAGAASRQVKFNQEVDSARAAFDDGDWAGTLYKLYRLREERRDRDDLALYIKNANYNWGIEALSDFDREAAIEHLKDALEMAPGDPVIGRHLEVANRYRRRQRDAAYDAYVSKLKPKALDEK